MPFTVRQSVDRGLSGNGWLARSIRGCVKSWADNKRIQKRWSFHLFGLQALFWIRGVMRLLSGRGTGMVSTISVLLDWIIPRQLRSNVFFFWMRCWSDCQGWTAKDGLSARKPWRIMTSSKHLANDSLSLTCSHSEHPSWRPVGFENLPFIQNAYVLQSLLSCAISQYVFSMPCVRRAVNLSDRSLSLGIHQRLWT